MRDKEKEKGKTPISLPQATIIAGTLSDLAKKYTAVADVGMQPVTTEKIVADLERLSADIKARERFGVPEAEAVAGTLDELAVKYKGAAEMDFAIPAATLISGTLDDLAKKYKGTAE